MSIQIIIYGAGERGRGIYNFFEKYNQEQMIWGFCDQNHEKILEIEGKKVVGFEEAISYKMPFLISLTDEKIVKQIKNRIDASGGKVIDFANVASFWGKDRNIVNRDFCAFFHVENMNQYFKEAEDSTYVFLDNNSLFYELFKQLDLKNVIELACGRGRHVQYYIHKADKITLVDILKKNIDFCKNRFNDKDNIYYYCNNGYNIEKLKTEQYTSLFCYDAMVHFEMMDIYEYLKDIYRVLIPGGKALLHHSNNTSDYKASFANAPHGRSFMSKDVFAYLAYRAGFDVLEQKVIDWGIKDLDCISLIQKPYTTKN